MDARTTQIILSRCRVWLALGCALSFWVVPASHAGYPLSDTIQVQTFPTHSRLIFRVDDNVPVDWKETPNGFQIVFKGLGFTDLGAPLGDEEQWAAQFKESLKDPRLASVELREVKGGLMVEGKWKFGSGPDAPAEPAMETFDYRERATGDTRPFVVDFWVKKGPTVAEVQALRKKQTRLAKVHKIKHEIQQRVSRRLASEKAKAELSDLTRFCAAPLAEEKDVFLPFLPVNDRIDYAKYFPKRTPDADFPYFEPKGEAQDAQYVRLALKLYREDKLALVLRTLDFMDAEHPSSPYRPEMRFLRANAMLKLGMAAQAEQLLAQIKVESKGKPVALHAALYLARKQVEGKDPLGTYETFSWLFTHYPDHRLAWLFHLGAAESLAAIKQTEQAAKEYQWVAENAKTPEQKAQGALRIGNLYLERRQYAQALSAYSSGLRAFRKQVENSPATHLNRGETLYSLGEYEEARKIFEQYAEKYTSYPEGWRATFRLGEIYGRREGADNEKRSRRWFYETINRFPFSAGSTLARLRLLPCADHGGFSFEAASRFFQTEAKEFDAGDQVSMVHFPDLRALAQVRSYIGLKREDEAADVAQAELSRVKAPQVKGELARLYEGLFRKNILTLLDHGKAYEALNYYEERSKYRVRDVTAADPDYLLRLSLAASELGLGKLGETLVAEYRKASGADRAIAAEPIAGKRESVDIDAKLQLSEQRFAEARALWIAGPHDKDSEEGAKNSEKIRQKLDQVAAESPFSFEKEIILGLLEERHGKLKTARSHALKAQLLIPAQPEAGKKAQKDAEKIPEAKAMGTQIQAWLAGLEARAGDPKVALGIYRDLEKRVRASGSAEKDAAGNIAAFLGVPPVPPLEQILMAQGRILEGLKRWGESAAVYAKAVDEGLGGNQAMYGYARALLKTGGKKGRQKALATLEKLTQSKTDDFWKKLAQDTLEGERLRDSHK